MSFMEQLLPPYFFDLSSYKHRSLFERVEFVWEALTRIGAYFDGEGKIEGDVSDQSYLVNPEKIWIGKGTLFLFGNLGKPDNIIVVDIFHIRSSFLGLQC